MKRILFVQHGDYRDAYIRFANGGDETYRDQKRSVDVVSALAPENHVTTLALGSHVYNTELAPNLFARGMNRQQLSAKTVFAALDELNPTHLILRTPILEFLVEIARLDCWVLPCFADIFQNNGIKQNWRNYRIRRTLSKLKVPCFSNHSLNASRSLVTVLQVPPDRVVPWDWSRMKVSETAKTGIADPSRATAIFAGTISEAKGVGDCLEAIARLSKAGLKVSLSIAGSGDVQPWLAKAEELKIGEQVNFLGMITNTSVREMMRTHDFILVPSRHNYHEGLPNVDGVPGRGVGSC